VVTVAPQSRASLARVAGLSALEAAQRLTGFFKSIGVARVLDAAAARDVSLLETGEEFVAAWREANES
jgi:iron only hydrogenase large subunit-like protein